MIDACQGFRQLLVTFAFGFLWILPTPFTYAAVGISVGDKVVKTVAAKTKKKSRSLSPQDKLERRLYKVYSKYRKRRNHEDEEIRLRQQILHERSRHHIGFDITFSDLGNFNFDPIEEDLGSIRGLELHYKYFPVATTSRGRVGLGGVAGVIGNNPSGVRFKSRLFNLGPRVSYEGLFTTGQVFVPVVFLGYEFILNRLNRPNNIPDEYRNKSFSTDDFSTFVYGLGVFLNLNRADPATGTSALVNIGIRKFDLAVMFKNRIGDSDEKSSSYFSTGLRFEY